MTDRTINLTIDVTDPLPTVADLITHGIAAMRVVTRGPGGGNPEVTLSFGDAADEGRPNALRFLADWYGSEDPAADYAIAAGTGAA
jgi:hypothetical protein